MTTFERVRGVVAGDLRPVRPILPPWRRVLLLTPIAGTVAVVATMQYGRDDFAALGVFVTWGLSALQWIVGMLLLGIALRRAGPSYSISGGVTWLTCVGASIVLAAATLASYRAHPTFVPSGRTWIVWALCVSGSIKTGLPLLVATCVLAARALPIRPAAVGALCGLATGIVADSGWRLTCWISSPVHVLTAHLFALLVTTGLGALLTVALDRSRWQHRMPRVGP